FVLHPPLLAGIALLAATAGGWLAGALSDRSFAVLAAALAPILVALLAANYLVARRREQLETEEDDARHTEALDQERYLLQPLLDNVPNRIYFKDLQSRFLCISQALAQRFGLKSAGDAIGKTDADFFSVGFAEQSRNDEQHVMRTGQPIFGKEEKEIW